MDRNRVFHQKVVRYVFKGTETVVAWGSSYPHLFRVGVNFGQKASDESQIYMNGYSPYRSVVSYNVNNVYTASNKDICINDVSCTTAEELKQAIVGKCIYILAENEILYQEGTEVASEMKSVFPTEHSASTTYSFGNLAFHNGELYEYTNSTASSGAWNPNYWTKVKLGNMAFLRYTVVSTF